MELKEIQNFKLDMLLKVVNICDEQEIPYYLYGGTLLGAVRHNGFIPWDDDIDICLLWNDYKKLLSILPDKIGNEYYVQNLWTEGRFPCLWTQLRANGTTSLPVASKKLKIHWGMCIDIFPLISIFDDEKKAKKQFRAFSIAQSFIAKDLMKAKGEKAYGAQKVINIIPNKVRRFIASRIIKNYAFVDSENQYLGGLDSAELKKKYLYVDFSKRTKLLFEGHKLYCPVNYESVLVCNYGEDYMTPPPPENRGGHDIELGNIINDIRVDYTEYL